MDSRKAAETVKKPFYAWVGLSDLALSRASSLPTVVKSLPQEALTRVKTLQERAGSVRSAADIYADQAGHAFSHFADRGEQVLARVRRQPAPEQPEQSSFDRVAEEEKAEKAETVQEPVKVARTTARRTTARKSSSTKQD